MSKKQFAKRYLLIINKLRRTPASFKDILLYLKSQSELEEQQYDISLRTFQRDLADIASIYNVEITYNRAQNVYEITHDQSDDRSERIIESFELLNALNLSNRYSEHLILEKRKPLGTEHLYGLLHAIKNNLEVHFMHQKYWDETDKQSRIAQPLALKESRNRWYLVATDTRDQKIKTFGLDRMSNLEIQSNTFKVDSTFNADTYFQDSFGIINSGSEKPQKVVLSFTVSEGHYIKSLPLHHSQMILSEDEQQTVFELHLHPTYDFVMELLSYGAEVQVLEPQSLREEIADKLRRAFELYKK